MCGRIALKTEARQVADEFAVAQSPPTLPPRYNIAPTEPIAAVLADRSGTRELRLLQWGLVPHWSRDPAGGSRMFNARGESVAEKPAFRDAFARRRCLIPIDGFYEWRRHGNARQPYYFHGADGRLLALAGLWDRWEYPGGAVIESCSVLTTSANDLMRPIHHRMPVILPPTARDRWLATPADQAAELLPLLRPAADDVLRVHPVSPRVNRAGEEGADLIAPQRDIPPGQLELFG